MATLQPLPDWVALEHQVQTILTEQEIHGWKFDTASAWELASTLQRELRETEESLRRQHPYVAGAEFNPKRDNRTSGYIKGASFTRLKETNCTSRDHISWILQTYYGWKPTQTTTTGISTTKPGALHVFDHLVRVVEEPGFGRTSLD